MRTRASKREKDRAEREDERQNQRISVRTDLEVLNSVDLLTTTSTSDSECVSEAEEQMLNPKRCTTYVWFERDRDRDRDRRDRDEREGLQHTHHQQLDGLGGPGNCCRLQRSLAVTVELADPVW